MSKYVVSGKAVSIRFDFLVEGQAVIPSSATYSVLKNDLTVVSGLNNQSLALAPDTNYVNVTVPDVANVSTLLNEVRYINVDFIYQGKTYNLSKHYFLVPAINFPLSAGEVRAVLGVSETEVPDEFIDILSAYEEIKTSVSLNVSTILTTGSSLLPTLIKAVKYKAALNCSIAIETLVMQSEQADNTLYLRFQKIDFAAMRQEILARLNESTRKLDNILDGGTTQIYGIVAVGTDPVTGA